MGEQAAAGPLSCTIRRGGLWAGHRLHRRPACERSGVHAAQRHARPCVHRDRREHRQSLDSQGAKTNRRTALALIDGSAGLAIAWREHLAHAEFSCVNRVSIRDVQNGNPEYKGSGPGNPIGQSVSHDWGNDAVLLTRPCFKPGREASRWRSSAHQDNAVTLRGVEPSSAPGRVDGPLTIHHRLLSPRGAHLLLLRTPPAQHRRRLDPELLVWGNRMARCAPRLGLMSLVLALCGLSDPIDASAQQATARLPPGFVEQVLVGGLEQPTSMYWAPDDHLWIGGKNGHVWTLHLVPRLSDFDRLEGG